MKNREVINWLTRIRDRLMTTNSKQYEALTIAIATMEKQEPMKPLPQEMDIGGRAITPCGFCGEELPHNSLYGFCPYCGQAIDRRKDG